MGIIDAFQQKSYLTNEFLTMSKVLKIMKIQPLYFSKKLKERTETHFTSRKNFQKR